MHRYLNDVTIVALVCFLGIATVIGLLFLSHDKQQQLEKRSQESCEDLGSRVTMPVKFTNAQCQVEINGIQLTVSVPE